jgi:hypothetical protein
VNFLKSSGTKYGLSSFDRGTEDDYQMLIVEAVLLKSGVVACSWLSSLD